MPYVQREKQLSHCHAVTHASHRNPVKCSKSRLVTTSAPKHFTPKVAYFYPKSGVLLPWTTHILLSGYEMRGTRCEICFVRLRAPLPLEGLGEAVTILVPSHLAPSKFILKYLGKTWIYQRMVVSLQQTKKRK